MPTPSDENEAAIVTATNSYCLWDFTNRVERIHLAILDIVFFEVGDAQNGALQYRRKEQFQLLV